MNRSTFLQWLSALLLSRWLLFFCLSCAVVAQNTSEARPTDSFAEAGTPSAIEFSLSVPSDSPFWNTGIGLRPGDLVEVSSETRDSCNPSGIAEHEDILPNVPLPRARFGALIGRLGQSEPFLVGQHLLMSIQNSAQLFFGANTDGEATCSDRYEVSVSVRPAETVGNASDVHSKLISLLDRLPRRVLDDAGHQGDLLNFVLIGSKPGFTAALTSAHWVLADERKLQAAVHAVLTTWAREDYVQMPMSKLYCFGRVQDFGYEMAQAYKVAASRHHFRLWRVPWQFEGRDLWIGAATHDVGFAKDHRNGHLTHKIDPNVDDERDFILRGLDDSSTSETSFYFTPQDAVVEAHNATGDPFHSDGRVLVIVLK